MKNPGQATPVAVNDFLEITFDLVARLVVKLDRSDVEISLARLALYTLTSVCNSIPETVASSEIYLEEIPAGLCLSLSYLGSPFDQLVFDHLERHLLVSPTPGGSPRTAQALTALRVSSLAWREQSFARGAWAKTAAAQRFLDVLRATTPADSPASLFVTLEEEVASATTGVRFKGVVEWLCIGTKSLWRLLPSTLPEETLQSYTEQEQLGSLDRCRKLRKKAGTIESELPELRKKDPAEADRKWMEMRDYNREISARMLGVDHHFFHDMATVNMFEATQDYIVKSEAYDPEITNDNLVQAARNVWTCYALQLICHQQPASCNGGVLGYSLLYPYTDNFLDDNTVPSAHKHQFQRTFGAWLEGDYSTPPATKIERKVLDQVLSVESKFPRNEFPNAFHSLTAINDAQTASLSQHAALSFSHILGVTVYKGGTSVLADLFMGDGAASDERDLLFSFLLGFGLQLVDDLQDVVEDSKEGHHTVFTRAQDQKMFCDLLVVRLIRLLDWTTHPRHTWGLKVTTPTALVLRTQMLLMCNSIVMKSIAQSAQMFSAPFMSEYTRYAPVPLITLKSEKSMKHLLMLVRKKAI